MPRGFKKSIPDTEAAGFCDRRSFRSTDGHDLLYGRDKTIQRGKIWYYYNATCAHCKLSVGTGSWEWHHVENEHNNSRRCDCIEGAEIRHKHCHIPVEHVQVQFGRRP